MSSQLASSLTWPARRRPHKFLTSASGGLESLLCLGAASNEAARVGIDKWKRSQLIQAGTDVIVPDFSEHEELVTFLFDA